MLCSHETQGMKIQDSLLRGNTWVGLSKKVSKEGNFYYTHSTILPIYHNNGKIKKFIEFATLISKYENEILALKKHILILKSENFKAYQELKKENQSNIELVGNLQQEVNLSKSLQRELDENVVNNQKLLMEIYNLRKQNSVLLEKLYVQEKRFEEFQSTTLIGRR